MLTQGKLDFDLNFNYSEVLCMYCLVFWFEFVWIISKHTKWKQWKTCVYKIKLCSYHMMILNLWSITEQMFCIATLRSTRLDVKLTFFFYHSELCFCCLLICWHDWVPSLVHEILPENKDEVLKGGQIVSSHQKGRQTLQTFVLTISNLS